MLLNLSLLKKAIALLLFTYCCLIVEFGSNSRVPQNVPITLTFNNFIKNTKLLIVPDVSRCRKDSPPIVVAMVISSSRNHKERLAIRASWANSWNSRAVRDGRAVAFFVVARPKSKMVLEQLKDEIETYNDILLIDLEESYENLVLKVYASMIFSTKFCPDASFHMKIDDDVVVHFDRLFHYLVDSTSTRDALLCKVWDFALPVRKPNNKWFVSKEEWPADKFPKYCNGPMYLIGSSALKKLLYQVPSLDLFRLEDVFFTGIAAKRARLQHLYWSKHFRHRNQELWWGLDECDKNKVPLIFSVHSLNSTETIRKGFTTLKNLNCTTKKKIDSLRRERDSKRSQQTVSKQDNNKS